MSIPSCPICNAKMTRHGYTSVGRQRWRCRTCDVSGLNSIDNTAKRLEEFLAWLLSGARQVDMPGQGRSFRRRCKDLWSIWPFISS
ncbi:transposase-like zinc-binding domain-containing protein [Gleimia europaea]|uniref:transposase-like zinc-binding domain-containing protein n=1 Tax=Gleimia europaea TaxID=66228 RepID=UPI003D9C5BA0